MTPQEEKQMQSLITREQGDVKDLKKWSKMLKEAEADNDRDILDRFEAFKYRKDCENVAAAKDQQVLAYLNIHKNMKAQAEKKAEEEMKVVKK